MTGLCCVPILFVFELNLFHFSSIVFLFCFHQVRTASHLFVIGSDSDDNVGFDFVIVFGLLHIKIRWENNNKKYYKFISTIQNTKKT